MNLPTYLLHVLSSSLSAGITAYNLRRSQTRPHLLAGFQLAESGSVPMLEKLSRRAADEGDRWLSEKLAIHANDERRHGQIFAKALERYGHEALTPEMMRDRAKQNPERKRSPFFNAYFKGYDREDLAAERMPWSVFMASTYTLEVDASRDFAQMTKALDAADPLDAKLKAGLLSIAADETNHAAYLYEAMQRRYAAARVAELTDEWRQRKTEALLAMVSHLLSKGGELPSMVKEKSERPQPVQVSEVTACVEAETQIAA
ncbi:MAG: ferritin-like domain-containing protein [Cyanobacteria bacterium J06648_11]